MKRIYLLLYVIIILSGCSSPSVDVPEAYTVRIVRVVSEPLSREIELSGNVVARYESVLSFQVGGRVITRLVDVGDVVKAGELIARLEPIDYELQVKNLESEVESALSDYNTALTDEQRFYNLKEQNAFSQNRYDRQLNIMKLAKGRLEALKARLQIAQNALQYTRLHCDYPGIISAIFAEAGQVVGKGQAIARLVRTEELEVAVSLPENSFLKLSHAQVEISLWGDPQTKYEGIVREVSPEADPQTRTYLAKIHIDQPDYRLALGRTVKVRFVPKISKSHIRLPMTAIRWEKGKAMIWVVDEKKLTVTPRKVSVGLALGNEVSITSGVADGEIVVTAGVHKLYPDQTVRILD